MHESLPLELFSPVGFASILDSDMRSKMVLAPWRLITAALTLPGFNTKTRVDLLEIRFWFLFLYQDLLASDKLPTGLAPKIRAGGIASLYSSDQPGDGMNASFSRIILVRSSPTPVCIDRLGSGPLEHEFDHARMRCHDMNTLKKMRIHPSISRVVWDCPSQTLDWNHLCSVVGLEGLCASQQPVEYNSLHACVHRHRGQLTLVPT
jgi:hypothetical protein